MVGDRKGPPLAVDFCRCALEIQDGLSAQMKGTMMDSNILKKEVVRYMGKF